MIFFNILFCSHDYWLVDHFTIPSEYDIIIESNHTPKNYNSLVRIYVSNYKCRKCNKLKRLKENTSR